MLETCRKPRHEADRLVGLAQQQRTCIRRDHAANEGAHNNTPLDRSKIKRIPVTLCQHRGVLLLGSKPLSQKHFRCVSRSLDAPTYVEKRRLERLVAGPSAVQCSFHG
jgi:hypothetical protein